MRPVNVGGNMDVAGRIVISIAHGVPPQRVMVQLTDPAGRVVEAIAQRRERADIAGHVVHPSLIASGFGARLDLSSLADPYMMSAYDVHAGGKRRPALAMQAAVKLLVEVCTRNEECQIWYP